MFTWLVHKKTIFAFTNGLLSIAGPNHPACKSDPDSQMCQMVMMGGMGGDMMEMDMDGPMEFDIEGPMAMQMLQSLNMEQKNVHPLHHEITLNEHVMRVLRNRFGVNTTQGIQAKSHDPQFQAFMYQVS